MKKALIYLLVFVGILLVAGGIVMAVYILMKGQGTEVDATGLILTTALEAKIGRASCRERV